MAHFRHNAHTRVLVTGLGRMGWAIARQFHRLRERFPVDLVLYDPSPAIVQRIRQLGRTGEILPPDWTPREAIARVRPRVIVHCAPYDTQPAYLEWARTFRCDLITLGQDTPFVRKVVDQYRTRPWRGARIVLDHGLAPGLLHTLAVTIGRDTGARSVIMECGGLPLNPNTGGPLRYGLSFSPAGLLREYRGTAYLRRDGRLCALDPLSPEAYRPPEEVDPWILHDVPQPLAERFRRWGTLPFYRETEHGWTIIALESAATADGTSVLPWDARFSNWHTIEYHTVRYAGHYRWFRTLAARNCLGDPAVIASLRRLPPAIPDIVLFRIRTDRRVFSGIVVSDEVLDAFPELAMGGAPVWTAMQHLTGWPVVWTTLALLELWTAPIRPFDAPGPTGQPVEQRLEAGGVLLPYEWLDGRKLWTAVCAMIPPDGVVFTETSHRARHVEV